MIEIHLNEDPGTFEGIKDAVIVVTNYASEPYEGSGDALVLRHGMIEYWSLGHCSCYGPGEDGPHSTMTVEAFRDLNQVVTCDWNDKTAERFIEEFAKLPVDHE